MTRFRLIVEYDGRPFMGWQRQAHGRSVQQSIEEAVEAITHEQVTLHAAGRTDAGVHALAMTAHVDIAKAITPHRLADGINAKLRPLPVAILAAEPVDEDFHARFSCTGRRYLYRIANRRAPLALEAGRGRGGAGGVPSGGGEKGGGGGVGGGRFYPPPPPPFPAPEA